MSYTNSPLVECTVLSPNHSGKRTHSIDRITPHCVVGQSTVESVGNWFAKKSTGASSNYVIGTDGRVGLIVDEANRSWCSSSSANDQRAVTIECASDKTHPYAMNDAVYNKLIELCVDICKRNGKTKLLWFTNKDKSLNYEPKADEMVITTHRWFANKACPGDWLYNRLGELAAEVTKRLNPVTEKPVAEDKKEETVTTYPAVPFSVQVLIDDLNYRSKPSMDGKVKGQTGKGTFTIVKVENGWGKLKSGVGYIWLGNPKYCTILGTTATSTPSVPKEPEAFKPYMVQVSIEDLNIRKGPGTNYDVVRVCPVGRFTIVEEADGKGAKKWGKLKSGAGWISLDYTRKV